MKNIFWPNKILSFKIDKLNPILMADDKTANRIHIVD